DDFFDIGGHSLAAAETLVKLEDVFDVRLPVSALLEAPTVSALQKRLSAGENYETSPSKPDPREDAVLESDISPEGEAKRVALAEAENIFLTGATGFLGAFLLEEFLRRSDATVHCLARRREGVSLLASIRENLADYGLWKREYAERISPVAGDLSEPLLGLDEETFEELSETSDLVFHAGAAVNLAYPYSALRSINVGGTREVLRFCCRNRTKPLHYISTNGVFPSGTGICREDADLEPLLDGLDGGYEESKWVAEKLVWNVAERGLPVCVYRPGNISGHSESGASNPKDFLTALMAEAIRVGAAPEVDGWRMEMTPVDFVAAAISEVSNRPDAFGEIYHLANPDPPRADEVFDRLEALGRSLERLELDEWLERRPPLENDLVGGVLGGMYSHDLVDGNLHDDENTRRILRRSGLERPGIDDELLAGYLRHFEERAWVPTPQHRA
ncbi:MAG: thioester reductase domain-containing protein, partial [Rubrobacteraceae bacterium]